MVLYGFILALLVTVAAKVEDEHLKFHDNVTGDHINRINNENYEYLHVQDPVQQNLTDTRLILPAAWLSGLRSKRDANNQPEIIPNGPNRLDQPKTDPSIQYNTDSTSGTASIGSRDAKTALQSALKQSGFKKVAKAETTYTPNRNSGLEPSFGQNVRSDDISRNENDDNVHGNYEKNSFSRTSSHTFSANGLSFPVGTGINSPSDHFEIHRKLASDFENNYRRLESEARKQQIMHLINTQFKSPFNNGISSPFNSLTNSPFNQANSHFSQLPGSNFGSNIQTTVIRSSPDFSIGDSVINNDGFDIVEINK